MDLVPDPGTTLAKGWQTSRDRAVTQAPDATGVHVLVAESSGAYAWRAVTTLSEPGFGTGLWVGNYCLTDRSHTVVVYAPRTFINKEELMERGAVPPAQGAGLVAQEVCPRGVLAIWRGWDAVLFENGASPLNGGHADTGSA